MGINVLIRQMIPSLETDEEIQEWIRQRKQRFPTKAKIFEKGDEESEKQKYTSTSSSDSELHEEVDPAKIASSKRVCKFFSKGKCKKGDSCSFLHESVPDTETTRLKKRKRLYEEVLLTHIAH
jgi:hypothetical protein